MATNHNRLPDSVSDGAERALEELVGGFSLQRAVGWLRAKFPSFDSSRAETLDCAATKSERDYFAGARLLGFVENLPESRKPSGPDAAAPAANRPLVVAAVEMRRELTERTSRLVQFNYAKKVLQGAIAKGALGFSGIPSQGLFFFHGRNGCFRLSLVTAEVEKRRLKWNAAKRQSFYIQPEAANNIVRRRLFPPVRTFADLKDAFSVEQLTKEFYRKLFDWYSWAMEPSTNVRFPNDIADRSDDRKYNNEAVIRLITRLMFTWFIRQRKLVPDLLFDRDGVGGLLKTFDPASMEQDNYYRAILQNLFFATFNCQPEKRRFVHVFRGKSSERHVTTLYRHEKEFKGGDGTAFRNVMKAVPFLNCALFDCLDRRERPEDGGRELYFDGFSGEKGHSAHLPNGLFFDPARGIISLFDRYEFTVDENDADDSDVALDPELLGKVFENLLGAFNPETEETARKATGSFYTPREIVDYMVEESLKNYLKGRLDGVPDLDAKLADLFDRGKAAEGGPTLFRKEEEAALLDALYACKVLDPACGSGAFPMGVLHCMVRLLRRLDPQNTAIRRRLLARYREDKASLMEETSLAELEARLREGQHFPDYERKLYLIENCIYGVDIQPIATQISKLRFFISLLCDQLRTSYDPSAENFGLLSLPNLEAKFVCANTLVSLPEVGALDASVGDIARLRQDLQENRHKIFSARSTATKEKFKNRDLEIRDAIRREVRDSLSKPDEAEIARWNALAADSRKRREAVAQPLWEEVEQPAEMDLFGGVISPPKRVKLDRNAPKRAEIDAVIAWANDNVAREKAKGDLANVGAATRYADLVAGWDPYDQNKSESWFDPGWMFNLSGGFDIVIGNPPYVLIGKEEFRQHYGNGFRYQEGKIDLYRLFIEKAFVALAKKNMGTISFITPNTFLTIPSCKTLRKFILEHNTLKRIVNFTNDVFEGVSVNSVVFLASTSLPCGDEEIAVSANGDWASQYKIRVSDCLANDYSIRIFANYIESCILNKMRTFTRFSEWDADVCLGLQPYHNSIHSKKQIEKRFLHADYQKNKNYLQELGGRDIPRYGIPVGRGIWLDYSAELYMKPDMRFFSGKRIVLREIPSTTLIATIVKDKLLVNKSCYIIKLKDAEQYNYLLGVLNSKAIGFWVANEGDKANQNLFPRITMATIKHLPIPEPYKTAIVKTIKSETKAPPIPDVPSPLQARIADLVDQVLAAKARRSDTDTTTLEAEIDQLVYALYGLTDEEIATVEGRGPASEENASKTTPRASSSRKSTPAPAPTPGDEVLE